MKTQCRSYGYCPCLDCNEICCIENEDDFGFIDTEDLCEKAREHCERCAKEYENYKKEGGVE